MPFSSKVQEDALVACGRFCCICHRFVGTHIEVHHIIQETEGGPNDFENAIPLCFDCHAEMGRSDARHPGRKAYTPSELKRHRDNWYKRVADGEPVQPDDDAEEFRKRYKELRNEANYVLTFYANVYTYVVEKTDTRHDEASEKLRDIGTKFKVLAEQKRGDCPEIPSNAELLTVFKNFIGLSNGMIVKGAERMDRRLEDVDRMREEINSILKIS